MSQRRSNEERQAHLETLKRLLDLGASTNCVVAYAMGQGLSRAQAYRDALEAQEQRGEEGAGQSRAGSGASSSSLASFLVKAANIPASTVGVIEVPYRGRTLKIAGDRTFEPWTVTVLNDKGFALRSKFEEWSTKIQALHQNLQAPRCIAE